MTLEKKKKKNLGIQLQGKLKVKACDAQLCRSTWVFKSILTLSSSKFKSADKQIFKCPTRFLEKKEGGKNAPCTSYMENAVQFYRGAPKSPVNYDDELFDKRDGALLVENPASATWTGAVDSRSRIEK